MGILRQLSSGRRVALVADQVVGRFGGADLPIESALVSAQHARIHWAGDTWSIRDLGSRNGTWIDGERLPSGETRDLPEGCKVAFGDAAEPWVLESVAQPSASLTCLDDAVVCHAVDGTILINLPDAAELKLCRSESGVWLLQAVGGERRIGDREVFEFAGRRYRFRDEGAFDETHEGGAPTLSLDQLVLSFAVSLDEEYVRISLIHAGGVYPIPPRRCAYVLLTLARLRLEDQRAAHLSEGDHGWIYTSDLMDKLGYQTERRLNVDIYRIREQFTAAEVAGATQIVERRKVTGQLRIGVANLVVEST